MNEVSDTPCFLPPPDTLSAWPRGDLIRSNYFIDSFSGPYHCSFPSIKHMPEWIMWPDTMGCLHRQKTTRLHPCGVCLCHAPSSPFISSITLLTHTRSLVLLQLFTLNHKTSFPCSTIPAQHLSSFSFYVSRHAGPAGLQVWAQEHHCADGSHSCVEVWGAAGLRDCAVGERWPPPGTSERPARLSTLQHDWKPQER